MKLAEQSDARERRSQADLQWTINRRRPVIAAVRPLKQFDTKALQLIRDVHSDLLFVGNAWDARDLQLLYDKEIVAIVDLALNEKPAQLGRDMIYCRFPLNDGDGNPDSTIALSIKTIVSLIRCNVKTLVACSAGMSRAPTIAAASIAMLRNDEPDAYLAEIIRTGPNDISPILWSNIKRVYNDIRGT